METLDQNHLKSLVKKFLVEHNCLKTYDHCISVGEYAYELGKNYLDEPDKARIAGYLHDISAIYPDDQRIAVAKKMGIDLYKEEIELPMIIHQKISKEIAFNEFNVTDPVILSAIECHTTLKEDYSDLDLVVFIADKIKWDQQGEPPYIEGLMIALDHSLEAAAFYYIDYLLNHGIQVLHPWLNEAYVKLKYDLGYN
ncbi:HD domain-containing protein [Enterococcus silesiacus]|uniref:bis(5'-nucleosyl)-tetraphosphatase (symmetrical) n=1 Tax=Enterococcus silesiacus TaxID=332949 RepID=A0AA91GN08_9ENTE|nr:HD domain-containing protein [Enterococcus silesiacus]